METTRSHQILLLLLLLCIMQANSQVVVATAGTQWHDSKIEMSWTLGEPVTFITKMNNLVTQGFQQPILTVTSAYREKSPYIAIEAYPNPTLGLLNLKVTELSGIYRVDILNNAGDKLFSEDMFLCNDPTAIDFSVFIQGIYFVRLSTNQNNVIESFKIIKQ
jgi:hypothetical protein